ncbi:DNA-binding transcriptional regulator CynR [compost metagenome]
MLPGSQAASRRWLEAKFEQHGLPPPSVTIESNASVSGLLSILHSTDLLTLVSEITLSAHAGQGLSVVPLDDMTWHRQIGLLTRRNSYQSPLTLRLLEILREHARGKHA